MCGGRRNSPHKCLSAFSPTLSGRMRGVGTCESPHAFGVACFCFTKPKLHIRLSQQNQRFWAVPSFFSRRKEDAVRHKGKNTLTEFCFVCTTRLPNDGAEFYKKQSKKVYFVPSSPAAPSFETKRSKSSGVAIPRTPHAAHEPLGLNH